MPSFDIVSEVDPHELTNAIDQANRELTTRFDFKGVAAKFELDDASVTLAAPSEFQLKQMEDILRARLIARGIDARCLEFKDVLTNVAGARQTVRFVPASISVSEEDFQTSMRSPAVKVK